MPYNKQNLPEGAKKLSPKQQEVFIATFNATLKSGKSEEDCMKIAYAAAKKASEEKVEEKKWSMDESVFQCLLLAETDSAIEIMRCGSWKHPTYGKFSITEKSLDDFILHFNEKVRGIDISIDLEHGYTVHKGAAAAWIKKLYKKGTSLLAEVEWTELGKEKVANGEYKYFSPEFKFQYTDAETGNVYNNVLLGGGLTNRPFIKEMSPVLLAEDVTIDSLLLKEEEEVNQNQLEVKEEFKLNSELLKALKLAEDASEDAVVEAVAKIVEESENIKATNVTLSEENKQLKATNGALNSTKVTLESDKIALAERVKTIETKLVEAEWDKLSSKYLSEGKLVPAQVEVFKSAFMANKEATVALMETLQPVVKLGEMGSAQGNQETDYTKLFLAKVAEIQKERNVSYEKALILAETENKDLFNKYKEGSAL